MTSLKQALAQAIIQLENTSDSPRLDAELLLAYCLLKSRAYLYANPDFTLNEAQQTHFKQLLGQRIEGVPIAYLLGTREFWSLPLKVSPATLIPRPETELLVELALSQLPSNSSAEVLDLGTGSGAIALALASERPAWSITASDCSLSALEIAKENAATLGLKFIHFLHSDWFKNFDPETRFDAIISNPPYIASQDPHLEQGDLRFEPQLALVSGQEGLDSLRQIIEQSLARLKPMGLLLLEHGYDQKIAVRSMLSEYGYLNIQSWQDCQGNDRASAGKRAK